VSLTSVKKGDSVMVTAITGAEHRRAVTAAGPKWITVGSSRYHRCDGRIESGVGLQRIESLEEYDERNRAIAACRLLHLWGVDLRSSVPLSQYDAIVVALRPVFDPRPSLPSSEQRGPK
jgi:hypothetical protein